MRSDPVIADPDVAPVMAEFIDSRRRLVDAMRAAAGNCGEVRRIAHQLAGSFDLYGFRWAGDQSRWIERNFSQVDPGRISVLARELRQHLDTVEIRYSSANAWQSVAPVETIAPKANP